MNVAERIHALLDEKHIRFVDFANVLGIFEENMTEWERGKYDPTIGQIVKISDYLNVTTDYLLKGEAQKEVRVTCPDCGKKIKLKMPPTRDKLT